MLSLNSMTLGEAVYAYPLASILVFIIIFAAAYFITLKFKKVKINKTAPDDKKETPKPEPAPSHSPTPKPVSTGELNVSGADDKTAAVLIGIAVEKSGVPPENLKFTSIARTEKNNDGDVDTDRKYRFDTSGELADMKYKITLNDNVYEVAVDKNEAAVSLGGPAATAPIQTGADYAGNALKAPLGGTILDLAVSVGETVKAGQVLLILEAMKMENEIVSPNDCRVIQIFVSKGSSVSTGDPLFILE